MPDDDEAEVVRFLSSRFFLDGGAMFQVTQKPRSSASGCCQQTTEPIKKCGSPFGRSYYYVGRPNLPNRHQIPHDEIANQLGLLSACQLLWLFDMAVACGPGRCSTMAVVFGKASRVKWGVKPKEKCAVYDFCGIYGCRHRGGHLDLVYR
jgi:hypothetical protein